MACSPAIRVHGIPPSLPSYENVGLQVRTELDRDARWLSVPLLAVEVSQPNATSNNFYHHTVSVATLEFNGPATFRATIEKGVKVQSAVVRPRSRGIQTIRGEDGCVTFTLNEPQDVMLEFNGDKWKAIHIVCNPIHLEAPTSDSDDTWYFGPGLNQGSAYERVSKGDGVNLMVPSGKKVYLASGAYITCRLNFVDVSKCVVYGHGIIYSPEGGYVYREHGGAIHMSHANEIKVEGVTSIGARGFSLSAGECRNIHVDRYRSFSSAGNGDGIDFFCSSDILIENCFLRNSDDCIALYSHRWNWYGDSANITIRNCVLLPDMAHAINMGTHGNPDKPETTTNVRVSNIDILDHEENQEWYQGTIAVNAGDANTL